MSIWKESIFCGIRDVKKKIANSSSEATVADKRSTTKNIWVFFVVLANMSIWKESIFYRIRDIFFFANCSFKATVADRR
jgi:hypothetical protein